MYFKQKYLAVTFKKSSKLSDVMKMQFLIHNA